MDAPNSNRPAPPPGFSYDDNASSAGGAPSAPVATLSRPAPPPGFSYDQQPAAAQLKRPSAFSVMDPIKAVGAGAIEGTGSLVSGVGALGQMIARPITAGINSLAGSEVLSDPVNAFKPAGDFISGLGQKLADTESDAAKQAEAKPIVTGQLLHPSTWALGEGASHPLSLLQGGANMVGQAIPLLAGGLEARGATLAPELAAKVSSGAALTAAEQAAVRAAATAGARTLGTGATIGGLQGAQGSADAEQQRIMDMTPDQLAAVPGYQDRINAGMSPDAAKADLASKTAQNTFAATLPVATAAGLVGATPLLHGAQEVLAQKAGQSVLRRIGAGVALEAPVQGTLGAAQQMAQNASANATTGEDRSIGEGSLAAFGGGAAAGGVFGAAGAVLHRPVPYPDAKPGSLSDAANTMHTTAPSDSPAPARDQATAAAPAAPTAQETRVPPITPPWIDPATGEVTNPAKADIVNALAEHMVAQHAATGDFRVITQDIADAWGVPKDSINRVRRQAQNLAMDQIAAAERRAMNPSADSEQSGQADAEQAPAGTVRSFDDIQNDIDATHNEMSRRVDEVLGVAEPQAEPDQAHAAPHEPNTEAPAGDQQDTAGTAAAKDESTAQTAEEPSAPERQPTVLPPEPAFTRPPYEMTGDEVRAHSDAVQGYGKQVEDAILGPDADAWRKALRQRDSSNDDVSNRGQAALDNIEGKLPAKDREALYGIGGGDVAYDDLADYRRAHSDAQVGSPDEAAQFLASHLVKLGDTKGQDPSNWTREQQVAYAGMREIGQRIADEGWDSSAIQKKALQRAASKFSDPHDAAFMLDRFMQLGGKKKAVDSDAGTKNQLAPKALPPSNEAKVRALPAPAKVAAKEPDSRPALSRAAKDAATMTVTTPEGRISGKEHVDNLVAQGYDKLKISKVEGKLDYQLQNKDGDSQPIKARQVAYAQEATKGAGKAGRKTAPVTDNAPSSRAARDAEGLRVKTPAGEMNGRAHVDQLVRDGFTRLESMPAGTKLVHKMFNVEGESQQIKARQLAYAKETLARAKDAQDQADQKQASEKRGREIEAMKAKRDAHQKQINDLHARAKEIGNDKARAASDAFAEGDTSLEEFSNQLDEAAKETTAAKVESAAAEAASSPQNDLPEPVDAAPPAPKEPEKIVDLGEKIGGARKDTSTSTGSRGDVTKVEDERPTWAKRYSVSQIVKSAQIGEEGRWVIRDERTKDRIGQARKIGESFASKEEAEQHVPIIALARNHRASFDGNGKGEGTWSIKRDVTDRKRVTLKGGFASRDEAMRYMAEHAKELLDQKTGFGEEVLAKPERVMRDGAPRREGNVDGKAFMDNFGFRGVEFGNWNNQAERQEVMNHAYDGLHDLAEVLNLPAKALSLNGDLGLAFGARGQGLSGARAHYERDYAVMNLTKMKGAGAVAHEWFHALDHYLGRLDGKASSLRETNARGDQVLKSKGREGDYLSHGKSFGSKARPELVAAYHDLIEGLFRKGEKFVEDTKRAEDFVGRSRTEVASKLKSLRDYLSKELTYGSRRKAAMPEQLARFDAIAEPILDGHGLDTEFRSVDGKARINGRYTNDSLESLNALLKEVRNRQGFNKEGTGDLDRLKQSMAHYDQRIKMLQEARAGSEKTRKIPTDFAMNAKEIDQGRASDYWTTQHEMAARAFSAYIEDRLGEHGNRSDFLSYGSDNKFYRLEGIRPFPEGEERVAINKSFDKFFGELKHEEGDDGKVRLYDRAGAFDGEREAPLAREEGDNRSVLDSIREAKQDPAFKELFDQVRGFDKGKLTDAYLPKYQELANKLATAFGVERVQVRFHDRGMERGGEHNGFYAPDANVISLNRETLKPHEAMGTFFHEFGHHLVFKTLGEDLEHSPHADALWRAYQEWSRERAPDETVASARSSRQTFFRNLQADRNGGGSARTLIETSAAVRQDTLAPHEFFADMIARALYEHEGVQKMLGETTPIFQRIAQAMKLMFDMFRGYDRRITDTPEAFRQWVGEMWNRKGGVEALDRAREAGTGKVLAEHGDHEPLTFDSPESERRDALRNMDPIRIEPLAPTERQKAAVRAAYNEQRDQGPVHMADGADVQLSPRGFYKVLSHSGDERVLDMVPHLRELLEHATPLWSEPANEPDRPNVQAYRNYGAKVTTPKGDYFARLVVREGKDGRYHYDHDATTAVPVKEGSPAHQPIPEPNGGEGASSFAKNKLAQWLAGGKKEPLADLGDSETAHDDSGEPMRPDKPRRPFGKASESIEALHDQLPKLDQGTLQHAKDWIAGKARDFEPAALGALQLRHVLELAGDEKVLEKPAKAYADLFQRMDGDRNRMTQEGADKVQKLQQWAYQRGPAGWAGKLKPEAQALFKFMHEVTQVAVDPTNDYERLLMRDSRGEQMPWTEDARKERIKALKEQIRGRSGDDKTKLMDEIKELQQLPARERARQLKYPELVAKWNALPQEAREQFQTMRDHYTEQSAQIEEAALARIDSLDIPKQNKLAAKELIKRNFEDAKVGGVYFPLMRFGDYWISARRSDGEYVFGKYESAQQAADAEKRMKAGGYEIEATGRNDADYKSKQAPSGTFMGQLMEMLRKSRAPDKVMDDIYQMFLKSLPEMSLRKSGIHRKNIAGYTDNVPRAFASSVFHGAHQISKARYGFQLQGTMEHMQGLLDARRTTMSVNEAAHADALLGELSRRHDWIMNPTSSKLASKLTGIGFIYHLAASPASAITNMLQVPQIVLPVLGAHHGWPAAMRVLGASMKDAFRTGGSIDRVLRGEELQAFKALQEQGTFQRTATHTLAGVAEGDQLKSNPTWSRVMNVLGFMFHKAEVINREGTGIAAFRLAREQGQSFEQAVRYADAITNGTHGDYSNANRARYMQGNIGKIALQFKSYSLAMSWLWGRNFYQAFKGETPEVRTAARRTLTGLMGMTGLMAGAMGLPIINALRFGANAAHAITGDPDEPYDFNTEFESWLDEHLGQTAGTLIAHGAANQLGADVASRTSMSDLWFRDVDRQLEGQQAYDSYLEAMAGPVGGMIKNVFVGTQQFNEGHAWRGIETMMPTAAKNAMKAMRFANEGVNNLRGDPIVPDVSTAEELIQALGFTPTRIAEQQRINGALMNYGQYVTDRRQSLINAYALANNAGDSDGRSDALDAIQQFNSTYPEAPIRMSSLNDSLRTRARNAAQADNGVLLPKRLSSQIKAQVGALAGG